MFEHSIQELRHRASRFDPTTSSYGGAVAVFDGHVVKSDTAVSKDLRSKLQAAIAQLENVPENRKDWHPGSDQKVLDLVHPSLFPLIYGRTRVLQVGKPTLGLDDCILRCGEGEALPVPPKNLKTNVWGRQDTYDPYSQAFQWLPCEVDISQEKAR